MSSTRTLLVVLSLVLILGTATVRCISLAVAELADGAVKLREDYRTSTSGLEYQWLKQIDEQVLYRGMPRSEVERLLGGGAPCPDGDGMEGRVCYQSNRWVNTNPGDPRNIGWYPYKLVISYLIRTRDLVPGDEFTPHPRPLFHDVVISPYLQRHGFLLKPV